jgi:Tachylectin
MALTQLFYGGNGTTPVDSGLPSVGVMYGVAQNGDLLWYRYNGNGESDRSGNTGWDPNSGNPIGNGWQNFRQILGCGDGVILAIDQNGDLRWYQYQGNGESDRSGNTGWHPNSGNPIGNGWQSFQQVFVTPAEGRSPGRLGIYVVAENGDLLWYSYQGNGESDRSGNTGWHPNSGNPIGNGWQSFKLVGCGGVIFGVQENGDLLWYVYSGNGESDRSGSTGWAPNSGSPIGNGWQDFRALFGGSNDSGGFGQVIYAVAQNGDMLWYRYDGNGENDRSGNTGWRPNSGNPIGNGW